MILPFANVAPDRGKRVRIYVLDLYIYASIQVGQ